MDTTNPSFPRAGVLLAALAFSACAHSAMSAPSSFDRMQALYARKDYKGLDKLCRRELQKAPTNSRAALEPLYFMASWRVALGDYGTAVPSLVEFRDAYLGFERENTEIGKVPYGLTDPRFAGVYYELGKLFFQKQNWRESLYWFTKAGPDPAWREDPSFHYRMGVCLLNTGEYEKARDHFLKEMQLDPREPGPLYNMACAYARQGNKRQAVLWLKKALDAQPAFEAEARWDKDFESIRYDRDFPGRK